MSQLPPLSLYIHIPWCLKKCPYCDFNSHAQKSALPEKDYIAALLRDLQADITYYSIDRAINTIFIGGGTPSLFSPSSFEQLLAGIAELIPIANDAEITLEANPGTAESAKFSAYRRLGINRLSIGVQSFSNALLHKLGRVHDAEQAINAVHLAKQAGFEQINLDLMFGLPGANLADCLADINTALALAPTHLSFYQLTLEPNTWFYKYPPSLPNDEAIYAMQTTAQALLAENGFQQYEISAYSLPGQQCRHNLNYWRFGDYLGIGAGAHGKITQCLPDKIFRSQKPKHPEHYLGTQAFLPSSQAIAIEDLALEFVMNQLRLKQGFTAEQFQAMTGLTLSALEPGLSVCLKQQLIHFDGWHYFCSDTGWYFLDSVLQEFMTG